MGYYSAMRKKDILPFATTQMYLEHIMLSKTSQTKISTVWYHLNVESKKKKFKPVKNKTVKW